VCLRHPVVRGGGPRIESGDALGDPVGQFDLPGHPVRARATGDGPERTTGQRRDVPGEHLVGVGRVQSRPLHEGRIEALELAGDAGGDEAFIDAGCQLRHPRKGNVQIVLRDR